jgi:hypothetical protein
LKVAMKAVLMVERLVDLLDQPMAVWMASSMVEK